MIQSLTMDTYEALYLTLGENHDYKYILSDEDLRRLDEDTDDESDQFDYETGAYKATDGMAYTANTLVIEGMLKAKINKSIMLHPFGRK